MSSKTRKFNCLICVQTVPSDEREKIYALGKCNHIVCYVCSARLRVICDQLECPTCRERLNTVIFSSTMKRSHDEYDIKDYIFNEKYGIYFENKSIEETFMKLLRYECQMCKKLKNESNDNNHTNHKNQTSNANATKDGLKDNLDTQACRSPLQSSSKSRKDNSRISTPDGPRIDTKSAQDKENQDYDRENQPKELALLPNVKNTSFDDVFGLKTHLDYVHRLKLCDLCLTHNKLFPFEFSYYNTTKLQKHKLEGERNTSHRGHPNCRLCGDSFFNQDDLIMHMSREHFYCHLCNHENERRYFNDYEGLRVHFKKEHYLCERDSCREERFTSVFANEIEYTIHMVHVHGPDNSSLSRAESRQFRTIMVPGLPHTRPSSSSYQGRTRRGDRNDSTGADFNNRPARDPRVTIAPVNVSIIQQRLPTSADFPTLDGGPNMAQPHNVNSKNKTENRQMNSTTGPSNNTNDQGPSTSSGHSTLSQRIASGSSRNSFLRTAAGTYGRAPRLDEQDFPPLPEAPKTANSVKKGVKDKNSKTASSSALENRNGFPTIDQLLTAGLAQATRQQATSKSGKTDPKQKNGNNKNHKQKPIKIQLS